MFRALASLLFAAMVLPAMAEAQLLGVDDPLHGYFTRTPRDRFTRLQLDLDAGRATLDTSGELPFLRSVLAALEIPVESQMLVYTATSLQKALISPRRPRALYFNDDTYVGFVPGGQIEIISLDPDMGSVFYIFDRLRGPGRAPSAERSEDCMNCHSTRYLDNIPALVVESVVPGLSGGGERAFRREQTGHGVPLGERFGGWHVTGAGAGFPRHWGNLLLDRSATGLREIPILPGGMFDLARYPVPTSDVLAHLLHEHQVGFVNRAILATYRHRALKREATAGEIRDMALPLVQYLLFADEATFPRGSIAADGPFRAPFQASTGSASSLREVEGETRLLRLRCSYMITSPAFAGLPAPLRARILGDIAAIVRTPATTGEWSYLPTAERRAIDRTLAANVAEYRGALASLRAVPPVP